MNVIDVILAILLVTWIVLCCAVVAACVAGGRTDDSTEKHAERERHLTNLAGVYHHPRKHL